MNIILTGPQGSGKGTQSQVLSQELRLLRIVPGDILRKESVKNPKIKQTIDSGKLVDDEVTFSLIKQYMEGSSLKGFIFDGFPRRISQYNMLDDWMKANNLKIDYLINLIISKDETVKRISSRRICNICGKIYNLITDPPTTESVCECGGNLVVRDDDKPEAIEKRLELYEKETKPVIEKARENGILVELDGTKKIEEVTKDILTAISK